MSCNDSLGDLCCMTFQDDDRVSFTHITFIAMEDGRNSLGGPPGFKQFQADLKFMD